MKKLFVGRRKGEHPNGFLMKTVSHEANLKGSMFDEMQIVVSKPVVGCTVDGKIRNSSRIMGRKLQKKNILYLVV